MSKYIIEIEDVPFSKVRFGDDVQNLNLYRANGFNALVFDKEGLDKLTPFDKALSSELEEAYHKGFEAGSHEATTLEYQQGLDDAWDCAKRIVLLKTHANHHYFTNEELEKIFGYSTSESVFYTNSASEAIEKIKAYEEQQKVKVGDWVFNKHVDATSSAKVTCVDGQKVYMLCGDGSCGFADMTDLEKTNVPNPKIEQLLETLKGKQRNCSTCKHLFVNNIECTECYFSKGYNRWEPKEKEGE